MIKHISKHWELSFVMLSKLFSVAMILPPQQSTWNIVRGTFSPLSALQLSLAFQQTYLSVVYWGSFLCWMLGSSINTFLPEYSGASPSAFSIVRRGYWKPVLTSFPRQHTRVSFERRTRENRSTDLRKVAPWRHQYALTTRPPLVSKQWLSSDRAVAKHSAAEKYYCT